MAERPSRTRDDGESASGAALASVGVVCARAAIVATAVGFIEAWAIARGLGGSVSGMGLATIGLWVPASFVAVLVATPLRAVSDRRGRMAVLAVLGVLIVGALVFAGVGPASMPVRAAPLEIVGALGVAWSASILRFDGGLRKPAAYVGVALAVMLQLFAARWVDAHRPYAAAMADASFVPRIMLRNVLQRVI